MREIPFDPDDPQAAFRPSAPSVPVDPRSGGWHSVGPPGFVAPPTAPSPPAAAAPPEFLDAGGGTRAAWNGHDIVADPATTHLTATDVADILMSTSTPGRAHWATWAALDLARGVGGVAGVAIGTVATLFGGSSWTRRG